MGEVRAQWPDLQADDTLSRGHGSLRDKHLIVETTMTRGELVDEISTLAGLVHALTAELQEERARPGADELLSEHRREIDERMEGVVEDVKSCLAALSRLETDVGTRLGDVERTVSEGSDQDGLQDVEDRLLGEVAKLQSSQQGLVDQVEQVVEHVVDLRSSEVELFDRYGSDVAELSDMEKRLREEMAKLQAGQQDVVQQVIDLRSVQVELNGRYGADAHELFEVENRLRVEVAKLQAGQQDVVDQVIDLRSSQHELGDRSELVEVENRLRAEVAKLQASQQDVHQQMLDLRSAQVQLGEQHGTAITDHQRIRAELDQVAVGLRETMQTLELQFSGEVSELRESHDHLMAHFVDLRTLQSEIGSRQMATIVENGRLRDELLREAEQLRAIVEESQETANKAMSRAASTADNNDALQAEFDENVATAERRLALLESLIGQVDQRLHASHTQVSQLAAQAVTHAKASEIAAQSRSQVASPDEPTLLAQVDARVAAVVNESSERFNEAWQNTDKKLAHVEAVSFENGRRGAAATDAVANRLRHLEARLDEFERLNVSGDAGEAGARPPDGWQFERRSRLNDF